jgi:hypothetical protein
MLRQIRKQACLTVPVRRKKNPRPAYVSFPFQFRRNMAQHLDIIKKG